MAQKSYLTREKNENNILKIGLENKLIKIITTKIIL